MTTKSQDELSLNTKIASVIRAVRTALAWSQQDLADRAHISKPTIARIESMFMSPRADTIDALITAFREEGVMIDILAEEVSIRMNKSALLKLQKTLSKPK